MDIVVETEPTIALSNGIKIVFPNPVTIEDNGTLNTIKSVMEILERLVLEDKQ